LRFRDAEAAAFSAAAATLALAAARFSWRKFIGCKSDASTVVKLWSSNKT
jgi:hypothetical protein